MIVGGFIGRPPRQIKRRENTSEAEALEQKLLTPKRSLCAGAVCAANGSHTPIHPVGGAQIVLP
jgi:hypothetical protein